MTVMAGPFAIAAALLALGGLMKAWRPHDTANALRGIGLPGSSLLVRVGGVIELVIGAAALIIGGTLSAVFVALSYSLFVAFVVVALRRDVPIATCGCFGKVDTPPSRVHVGINLVAVAAAVTVAVDPSAGLMQTIRLQPLAGVPYVLLVGLGVELVYVALTSLPRTLALVPNARGWR
jgi:methylamine utilization protein MauE